MEGLKSHKWFVAQYKPNSDLIAKKNLERQGISTFMPIVELTKRKKETFFTEKKALFPGYIFISFDEKKIHWSVVNSTLGVNRLLVNNNNPQIIPQTIIKSLKARCDSNGKLLKEEYIETGSRVQVVKGPFSKIIGKIETIDTEKRLSFLYEILGRQTKITLSKSDVIKIT